MNPGQGRFHDFIMRLVAPGNEAAAEAILANSFGQQDAGRLTPDAVDAAVAQLTPLLKPEGVDALQRAAARMKEIAQHEDDGEPGHWGHDDGMHHHDGMHFGEGGHHTWPGRPDESAPSAPNPAAASQPDAPIPAPNPAAESQSH